MSGIKITKVSKFYEVEKKQVKVLNGIDLDILSNQITIILGRSGCGKTTLLRLVAGLEQANQGAITYTDVKRKAYVFQEDRLMPWLDAKKNITFGLKKAEIDDAKISQIIEMVGLKQFENAYPHQLSGGMKQRVSIARAFAYQPDFILMDEPFSALDFFTREQMQKELLRIHEKTMCSILFVTHSIDEALMLGNKIVILERGLAKSQYEITERNQNRDLLDKKFVLLKKQITRDLQVL